MTPEEWFEINRERGQLIDKSIASNGLTEQERERLKVLQRLAEEYLTEVCPSPQTAQRIRDSLIIQSWISGIGKNQS